MKQTRKLLAMLLCIAMVLGMATTVFADEAKYEYEIFQIFTGEFEEDVLTNVKWGQNGMITNENGTTSSVTPGDAVTDDILAKLQNVAGLTSDEAQLAVILKYANLTSEPYMTQDSATGNITIKDSQETPLPDGYYLVRDKAESQSGESEYYTTYIVEVVDGTLTIERKGDAPEVTKKIVENNTKVDENEASIGDIVTYEIVGTLPDNLADFDSYFYKFTDTLSKGLTFNNDIKVTVNGVDVTDYFYKKATAYETNKIEDKYAGGTSIIVSIQDLLALDNDMNLAEDGHQPLTDKDGNEMTPIIGGEEGTKIVITYTATLNEYATVDSVDGNPNKVDLEYSNDPNNDGEGTTNPPENPDDEDPEDEPEPGTPTGKTPESEVVTYTTEVIIDKVHVVDGENVPLAGAEFTITGNGVNYVVTTGEVYVAYAEGEEEQEGNVYYLLNDGNYTATAPTDETAGMFAGNTKYHKETQVTIEGVAAENGGKEVKAFVDPETGVVKFTGLGAGTYTISESVVPDGYNDIPSFTVTIGWSAEGTNCTWSYVWSNDAGNTSNETTVVNQAGSTLPETGGIGTTLFYVFGGIMVLGAAVLLVTKKRMTA